jgi:hypothetical protein
MKTITVTIGQEVEIYSYSTKQKGYGRQALYVDLMRNDESDFDKKFVKKVYVQDVFPNILEHFQNQYYLQEYSTFDEEAGVYRRDSGYGEYSEDCIFKNTSDLLNHALAGTELEIEIEEENEG